MYTRGFSACHTTHHTHTTTHHNTTTTTTPTTPTTPTIPATPTTPTTPTTPNNNNNKKNTNNTSNTNTTNNAKQQEQQEQHQQPQQQHQHHQHHQQHRHHQQQQHHPTTAGRFDVPVGSAASQFLTLVGELAGEAGCQPELRSTVTSVQGASVSWRPPSRWGGRGAGLVTTLLIKVMNFNFGDIDAMETKFEEFNLMMKQHDDISCFDNVPDTVKRAILVAERRNHCEPTCSCS